MGVEAQIPGPIAPIAGQAYATHFAERGRGGWQSTVDSSERDAIPAWRRWAGMACMVLTSAGADPAGLYTLDQDLTTWNVFEAGAGDFADLSGTATLAQLPTGNGALFSNGSTNAYRAISATDLAASPADTKVLGTVGGALAWVTASSSFSSLTGSLAFSQRPPGGSVNTYFRGDGSWNGVAVGDLTGVPAWSPTIASLVITGDLTVQGTHTIVDSTSVQVKDRVVQVNRTTGTAPAPVNICGLSVLRGNTGSADRDPYGIFWDEANSTWVLAANTGGDDATLGADLALRVGSLRVSGLSTGIGHYDASGNLTSSLLVNADIASGAAIAVSKLATTTAGSVLVSGASPAWSASPTLTALTLSGLTASRYVVTDGSKALASQSGVPLADVGNSGGSIGDIPYWSGSAWTRLGIGGANTVLKGGGATPAWGTLGLSDLTSGAMGSFDLSTTGTWYSGGTSAVSGSASQAKDVNVAAGSSATVISFTPPANATVKVNFSCVAHGGGLSYYCDVVGLIRTNAGGVITIVTAFSTVNQQGDAGVGYVTFSAASSGGNIVLTAAISVGASATYRCAAEVGRLKAVA